jgi:hypothetical protein
VLGKGTDLSVPVEAIGDRCYLERLQARLEAAESQKQRIGLTVFRHA